MVKRILFLLIPALFLLYGCPAGPPTGPDVDISRKLAANCLLSPYEDTLKVFLSNWSEISEYDDDFSYDLVKNPFGDYWSVAGATVSIAVNGKYLPVEEDTVTGWMEYYENNYIYYYRFSDVDVCPGQQWELIVAHPDYDILYAETIIPDSVTFVELPQDTIKNSTGNLRFTWNKADWAEGYLPLLMFTVESTNSDIQQQEVYTEWDSDDRVGTSIHPQKSRSIHYSIPKLLEQIKDLNSGKYPIFGDFNQYNSIYLQFNVYSMDEALYNIQRWDIRPDEVSGFNAPIQVFSNVVGGSGILGAFWHTKSPEIPIKKELLVGIMQNR